MTTARPGYPVVHARLEVLTEEQMILWPMLGRLRELGFILYGGTAIALTFGHRKSRSFSFLSGRDLDLEAIRHVCPVLESGRAIQQTPNAVSLLLGDMLEPVKVSFFGGVSRRTIGPPHRTDDTHLPVASPEDLMATRVRDILNRVEAKDYRDIAAMLKAGVSLERGLAGAQAIFGASYQPAESLKALTYFKGGDLDALTEEERRLLCETAIAVRELPPIELTGSLSIPVRMASSPRARKRLKLV